MLDLFFFPVGGGNKILSSNFWFPLTVATPRSVRNLTFICRVDGMAPIAWIHGLPRIVVYGENEFTTMNVTITSLPSMLIGREI